MRQLWSRGPLLLALGAVALVGGAWLGLVPDDAPEASTRQAAGSEPVVDLGDVMDFVPGCTIDTCSVLARRGGFRFDGKDAMLILVATPMCGDPAASEIDTVGLHLVTSSSVLWSQGIRGAACVDPIGGIETDRARNAFVKVRVGGEYQVIVLRIRDDEVEDFGSFDGRFRGHEASGVRDLDDDGVLEVVVVGDKGASAFHWTGREYEER
ncbi:MAG TPA: hypothetical protein VI916_09420 [Acidimicrobiia bacterium]|nr:hypothetical protein [Acidimicrobiia bacterium]